MPAFMDGIRPPLSVLEKLSRSVVRIQKSTCPVHLSGHWPATVKVISFIRTIYSIDDSKWVILIHWCVKNESFQDNILRIKRKLIQRKKVEILQNQDFTIQIKQFDWMVNWSGQVEIHAAKTWFLQNTKNHKLLKIGWLMT